VDVIEQRYLPILERCRRVTFWFSPLGLMVCEGSETAIFASWEEWNAAPWLPPSLSGEV
jgi:hypothetical protein